MAQVLTRSGFRFRIRRTNRQVLGPSRPSHDLTIKGNVLELGQRDDMQALHVQSLFAGASCETSYLIISRAKSR